MLLQMALFHSFQWLSNIPFYIHTTSYLSMHLLTDIWVVSMSWLLLTVLLWTLGCMYLNLNFKIHLKAFRFSSSPQHWLSLNWNAGFFVSLFPLASLKPFFTKTILKLYIKSCDFSVQTVEWFPLWEENSFACWILLHQSTTHLPEFLHYPWLPSIE